jgi:MFS transporter, PAT family, beta-lactamase induction signal transducer AmpG
MKKQQHERNPWAWIPSLYFIEGIPYVMVMIVSVVMYKRLGISNSDIALYTSWLYLPWVIKPLWSPIVDIYKTKRFWIVAMQLLLGGAFAGVAFTLPMSNFFQYSLAFFWLMAFCSSTNDIATDGFYMLGLDENKQAYFVGIRSTFYRLAMITGQGLIVIIAGVLEESLDVSPEKRIVTAWMITLGFLSMLLLIAAIYHYFFLPKPDSDQPAINDNHNFLAEFIDTFKTFFQKDNIIAAIAFLLLFRFGEAQLAKIASLFLLDNSAQGGLAITTKQLGLIYGTIGVAFLTLGGIVGGIVASRNGMKYWLWWMMLALNVPNLIYVFLSYFQPQSLWIIGSSVALEQLGYGFGFTAYMLYMIYISEGKYKTAHFSIATAFMALGMMLPGMFSGWLQELIGYKHFFIWVFIAGAPGFIAAYFLKIDPKFGKKKSNPS